MSSIIKCGPSPSKLAFWVDWKMADIISPLPGCSKRKSGKSISVEEQQIILNVAKYFQEESKSGNKPQFRAGAVIAKTAAVTGVSKNSVRKIVSAGKVIDEGKTRKAKVRFGKLDNFDVGVIRRIIHNLYRENISPRCTFQILGGCQGRRTGVGVTTVSNSLILGGWVTKVLKNGDKK